MLAHGVRVGAATFVLGLTAWAGPVPAVAFADTNDPAGTSASPSPTDGGSSPARAAHRGPRAASAPKPSAATSSRSAPTTSAAATVVPPEAIAGARHASRVSPAASTSAGRAPALSAQGSSTSSRIPKAARTAQTRDAVTRDPRPDARRQSTDDLVVSGPEPAAVTGPAQPDTVALKPVATADASIKTVPATTKPVAADPAALNPVATANAAINTVFDSLATLLSGLPQGPFTDFLGGALLLVRRSLFNQAPTAKPVQWGQTETDVIGTIGGVDAEADPISYTLRQAPQHGSVAISADGTYTYTPDTFAATDSTDTFTVSVADSATRLLGPISTNIVVPVSINGTDGPPSPPPTFGTAGFTVYNWTQYDIQLVGIGGDWDELDGRPADGTVVTPGHSFHYELNSTYSGSEVTPTYKTSNGVVLHTYMRAGGGSNPSAILSSSEYNYNSIVSVAQDGGDIVKLFFLDPPNTSAALPADKQKQTDLINWMCGSGPGQCSFKANIDGPKVVPGSAQLGSASENKSDTQNLHSFTYSFAETSSVTAVWEVNGKVTAKLGDKAGAEIGGKYGEAYTYGTTATYSETVTRNLAPWSYGAAYATPSFASVTGDVVVTLWNTTWTFSNVQFNFPAHEDCTDKTCTAYKGIVQFRQEPLQDGFKLKAVGTPLENGPEYYLGDPGGDSHALKLTAFNGTSAAPADYTTKAGVTYKSSNPSVATISNKGVLTAVAEGKTTITATYPWQIGNVSQTVTAKLDVVVKSAKPVQAT